MSRARSVAVRVAGVIVSLCVNGLGVALMRLASLGTEPFTCLNYSLAELFEVPLTVPVLCISAVLLLACAVWLREAIGFGTVANMILLGMFGDMWQGVLGQAGLTVSSLASGAIAPRVCMMACGMALMVLGSAFYMGAGLGASPYDALGSVVEHVSGGRVAFRWARMAADALCVIIAFGVASIRGTQWELVGIGTFAMVCCVGPVLSLLLDHVARPFYAALDDVVA